MLANMKLAPAAAFTYLLGLAQAVNMIHYSPQQGVEPAFFEYVKSLYASTEDPAATTSFYDYFAPPGNLTVLSRVAIGYDNIIALKQDLNPPAGYKQWNHMPNVTTVFQDTPTAKVYQVLGVIQTTNTLPSVHNCSQAYFSSHFTVLKDSLGNARLQPHGQGLVIYDDYVVDPPTSPTNISCRPSN